jgi:hypothetical protein
MKDDPKTDIWYCAEVRKILADRIEVNYYTTATPTLEEYREYPILEKEKRLKGANFLRTWCVNREAKDCQPQLHRLRTTAGRNTVGGEGYLSRMSTGTYYTWNGIERIREARQGNRQVGCQVRHPTSRGRRRSKIFRGQRIISEACLKG